MRFSARQSARRQNARRGGLSFLPLRVERLEDRCLLSVAPFQELSGFRALSGDAAAEFVLPNDLRPVTSFEMPTYGLTYERYQQTFGPADVLGGQLTLYRDNAGVVTSVIGSYYPDLTAGNVVGLDIAAAVAPVDLDIGPGGNRNVDLMINPESGSYFFEVETQGFDSRWFHWIDAGSGQVVNKYNGMDAIDSGQGIGVKGDTKDLSGLTTDHDSSGHGASGAHWDLSSIDNRQHTYDYGNRDPYVYYVSDADNAWDLVTNKRTSPGHPALIDAQYYANVTDDYLQDQHGIDWVGDLGYTAMDSVAHYKRNYNNAFWNGTYTVFGDGDGVTFRELSGSLDVVAHEYTHGVTEATSSLIYQNESGALNESFSDIIGASVEFYAHANSLDPRVTPDWWIGEDVYLPADAEPGFRNMADPAEDGDPAHYDDRYTGTGDNGGVHINSGIPNHAYYMLVTGNPHASSGVSVTGIGLTDAEQIFYAGFTALSSNATFADARAATVAASVTLFGEDGSLDGDGIDEPQSVRDAWTAVGVEAPSQDEEAPAAPIGLDATAGAGQVSLDWADNGEPDLAGYNVYRSDAPGGPYTEVALSVATSEYVDTGLTGGATYYYVVTAVDTSNNESVASSEVSATPLPVEGIIVMSISETSGLPGERIPNIVVTGSGFQNGATVDFGSRIAIQSVTFVSATELKVSIKIHRRAADGLRDVTVTNPDASSGTLTDGFTVGPSVPAKSLAAAAWLELDLSDDTDSDRTSAVDHVLADWLEQLLLLG